MIGKRRFERFSGKAGGFGGLDGYITCGYVELVEALGRPNIAMSNDRKTAFGWRVQDNATKRLYVIYAWKATRDYDKRLPTRAALRRAPSHTWHVSSNASNASDVGPLASYLTDQAGRTITVDRE